MLQMKQIPLGQGSIGAQLDTKFEITTKTLFQVAVEYKSLRFEGEVE